MSPYGYTQPKTLLLNLNFETRGDSIEKKMRGIEQWGDESEQQNNRTEEESLHLTNSAVCLATTTHAELEWLFLIPC